MFTRRSNNLGGELTDFISDTFSTLTTGWVELQKVKAAQAQAAATVAAAQAAAVKAATVQAQMIPSIGAGIPWNLILLGGGAIAAVFLLTKKKKR